MGQQFSGPSSCCNVVLSSLQDDAEFEGHTGRSGVVPLNGTSVLQDVGAQSSTRQHRPPSCNDELQLHLSSFASLSNKDQSEFCAWVAELWPKVAPQLSSSLEIILRQRICDALTRLPKGCRGEARLGVVHSRREAQAGPVYGWRHLDGCNAGTEVTMRLRFDADADLELRIGTLGLQISHVGVDGDASLFFAHDMPADRNSSIGGIRLGFVNPPAVSLGLKRIDGPSNWAAISVRTRYLVNSIFRNAFAIPQCLAMPFTDMSEENLLEIRSPLPRMVLRIQIIQARGLFAAEPSVAQESTLATAALGAPSPFCCLRLGTSEMRTPVCHKMCDPRWNGVSGNFYVYDERQWLQLDVFNADLSVADDLLGSLPPGWNVVALLRAQAETRSAACRDSEVGIWLPLKNDESEQNAGAVRLSMQAFKLETGHAASMQNLMLRVRIHSAEGLSVEHAQGAAVRLWLEGRSTSSNECRWIASEDVNGGRWAWEEALCAAGSSLDSARLELKVQDRWLPLGDQSFTGISCAGRSSSASYQQLPVNQLRQQHVSKPPVVHISWQVFALVPQDESEVLLDFVGDHVDLPTDLPEHCEGEVMDMPADQASVEKPLKSSVMDMPDDGASLERPPKKKKSVSFSAPSEIPVDASAPTKAAQMCEAAATTGSAGMQLISELLRENPCAWCDGAGGWHPALIQGWKPKSRCWGPMTWADGIDGYLDDKLR